MYDVDKLEEEVCRWLGLADGSCVACSSGTSALHLAMEVVSRSSYLKQTKVIVQDYNMVAVPRMVSEAGFEPVFVDCEKDSTALNAGSLLSAMMEVHEGELAAVVVTHLYGRRNDMDKIHKIVQTAHPEAKVVEDLAELHGVAPHPDTFMGTLSFYKNKVVCGEEGGCVVLGANKASGAVARHLRSMRSLGHTSEHDYYHEPQGFNYRLADSLACKIRTSLKLYQHNLEKRKKLEGWYAKHLPLVGFNGLGDRLPTRESPWVFDVMFDEPNSALQSYLVERLQEDLAIDARHGFKAMTWQKEWVGLRNPVPTPNAQAMSHRIITLPLDPVLDFSEEDVKGFCEAVVRICRDFRPSHSG